MKKKLFSLVFALVFIGTAFAQPEPWTIHTSCGGVIHKMIDSEATLSQIYDSIQAANVADCGHRAGTITLQL